VTSTVGNLFPCDVNTSNRYVPSLSILNDALITTLSSGARTAGSTGLTEACLMSFTENCVIVTLEEPILLTVIANHPSDPTLQCILVIARRSLWIDEFACIGEANNPSRTHAQTIIASMSAKTFGFMMTNLRFSYNRIMNPQ
jgi:hypothetical protein